MSWTKITKNNFKDATPFCEYIDYSLFRKFIDENKIVSYKTDIGFGTNVLRFFRNGGKSCGKEYISMKGLYEHPFIDHYMFYKTEDGEVIFTSQPYVTKEYITNSFNLYFTSDYELKVYESSNSWYYPGKVTLFTVRLKKNG